MISFIFSLEIIIVVCFAKSEERARSKTLATRPDLNIFLWIAASIAGAAVVNPNFINF